MRRKWIIVEDDQAKLRAYVRSFLQIYDGEHAPFRDQVTILVFREDDENDVKQAVKGQSLLICERVDSHGGLIAFVKAAKEWRESIIVLLDFLLAPPGQSVLQNSNNVLENWDPIEQREGDDIICLVTSEYNAPDYIKHFTNKGVLGDCDVTGGDPTVKICKATRNILKAHQEWTDRYDHPGKKVLHALMLAQAIGSPQLAHINQPSEIHLGFPFKEALVGSDHCLSSFKALFHLTTEDRVSDYYCDANVVIGVLKECGVGCDIVVECENGKMYLPMSPGALYLFRLCYLIRMLRDEKHANPVAKIGFSSSCDPAKTTLHFNNSISNLADAFMNLSGGTVTILKTFEINCVAVSPPKDETLKRTFEKAKLSAPQPKACHVDFVSKMKPSWPNHKAVKVEFEDKVIVLKHGG